MSALTGIWGRDRIAKGIASVVGGTRTGRGVELNGPPSHLSEVSEDQFRRRKWEELEKFKKEGLQVSTKRSVEAAGGGGGGSEQARARERKRGRKEWKRTSFSEPFPLPAFLAAFSRAI